MKKDSMAFYSDFLSVFVFAATCRVRTKCRVGKYTTKTIKRVKKRSKFPLCSKPFYSFGVGFGVSKNAFSQGVWSTRVL